MLTLQRPLPHNLIFLPTVQPRAERAHENCNDKSTKGKGAAGEEQVQVELRKEKLHGVEL